MKELIEKLRTENAELCSELAALKQQKPVAAIPRCSVEGPFCNCPDGVCNDLVDVFLAAGAQPAYVPLTPDQRQAMWIAATIEHPSQENCYLRGVIDGERAAGAQPVPESYLAAMDACIEFVRKCESGEAKSYASYTQMKKAIAMLESAKKEMP